MTKQINVGFNGSASSSEAVSWAAAEASTRGARLRIISCHSIPVVPPAMFGWTASEAYVSAIEETQGRLQHLRAVIAESHPRLEVTTLASSELAASVLVKDVDADDLVVVGTTNPHGDTNFWLGSTARHVVRHSPCPVVVVPGPGSWTRPERVVVGVDGSPTSTRALQWAGDEADRYGATLLVVHGWMYPYLALDPDSSQARDLTKVDAACVVDRAVESAREQFAAEITGRLIENSPAAALLGTVRHGDLLVLGSHGHGAIHATLFGSTVSSVLDRCAVPTVVVRSE
jgi:nucleotide-binding universal stress UspA family protein